MSPSGLTHSRLTGNYGVFGSACKLSLYINPWYIGAGQLRDGKTFLEFPAGGDHKEKQQPLERIKV